MCVVHGLLCAAALGVSVVYCERKHLFVPWEVHVTVTICLRMTSVSAVCSCVTRQEDATIPSDVGNRFPIAITYHSIFIHFWVTD